MRPDGPRDKIIGPDSGPQPPFPLRMKGEVVSGFGRGSKEVPLCTFHTHLNPPKNCPSFKQPRYNPPLSLSRKKKANPKGKNKKNL